MIQEVDRLFIGFSNDDNTRYQSTSGGIGSSIVKYLFLTNRIKSALSFSFSKEKLMYQPKLVYNISDYEISGSIYHEIDLFSFIKSNIKLIRGPFLCFALPCQVKGIRHLLMAHNIQSYIIELTCSSQQSYEATKFLFKSINLKTSNIDSFRYRGDGWPSGISILSKNGEKYLIPNNGSIWTKIFHSQLFIMKRCFFCNPNIQSVSDITLADPWRICNAHQEKKGQTLCYVHTESMLDILSKMVENNHISIERIDSSKVYEFSQYGTIARKRAAREYKKFTEFKRNLFTNLLYVKLMTMNLYTFQLHCAFLHITNKIIKTIYENTYNRTTSK